MLGDELRIKQILNNLLSNAFKYTDKGKIEFSVSAEIQSDTDDVSLIFRVSDTGQGMTQEQINTLFEEYTRFNAETNKDIEGIGLGMSITNKLINLMNGKIFVKSEIEKGSEFIVRLPQIAIDKNPIGKELIQNLQQFHYSINPSQKTFVNYEYMPYGSVLIVDDVDTNLYVAKALMQPYGLKIDTAKSGFEAIDKIKKGNVYDIIFMDHMMPKMDGIETTVKMRNLLNYAAPIVALTANAISGQTEIFLKNGFDDFMTKPVDTHQLNKILTKLIRDKQTPETLEATLNAKKSAEIKTAPKNNNIELLSLFARDAKKSVAVLETTLKNISFVSDKDLKLFAINAHAMKNTLLIIGENKLSEIAALLEQAGKENDTKLITAKTQEFIGAINVITAKVNVLEQEGDSGATVADPAFFCEQLKIIDAACAEYCKKTADAAVENLKKMSWNKEIKEDLNKISDYLLNSDFEEASELAKSMLEKEEK
jgi:CheY-like chemotaxis protein